MTQLKKYSPSIGVFMLLNSAVLLPAQFGAAAELTLFSNEDGAIIYEVSGEGAAQKNTVVGKTPLTLKDVDSADTKLYKIEKAGFATVYLPITSRMKSSTSISVVLKKSQEWAPSDIEKRSLETAEDIVDQVYSIQSLLDSHKSSEAMGLAEALKGMHPSSFSVRLVYANALLVSGEVAKAQALYTVLIDEIPPGRAAMKSSIQKIIVRLRGGRMPASTKGQR